MHAKSLQRLKLEIVGKTADFIFDRIDYRKHKVYKSDSSAFLCLWTHYNQMQ